MNSADGTQGMTQRKTAANTPSSCIWSVRGSVFLALALPIFLLSSTAKTVYACGGCFRLPYQSLLERVEQADRVVVARADGPKGSPWKIDRVIKGGMLSDGETIAADNVDLQSKTQFGGPHLLTWNQVFDSWTIDAPSNRELADFLSAATAQSPLGNAPITVQQQMGQIRFFLPYLEHRDVNIADSSHAKLSKTSYAALQRLSDDLDADQLLTWIENQPATRIKRVALSVVLLGICGGQREAKLVEEWIDQCSGGGDSAYLTALLTAHIELGGEPAVQFLEESYIRNRERTLGEVIAAVDALRTHGQANTTVSRERIKASFQLLLRVRAPMAETIIEDFARWEDWSIAPPLIEIYASGKQPWNNAMIVKYLKACPLPQAKQFLQRIASDG